MATFATTSTRSSAPATPHFAYQLRARVRELARSICPRTTPVRRYAEEKMELLDRLGHASSKADEGRARAGDPARLGRDSELGAGRRAPSAALMTPRVGPRHRAARAGSGGRSRCRFVAAGAEARRARLPAERQRRRGGGRGPARSGRSRCSCAATSPRRGSLQELAALGPFDALVHNAATGVIRPALQTERQALGLDAGTRTRARSSRSRALRRRRCRAGSSIVAISQPRLARVLENYVLVGASKAALESLVRYLAVELAPRGIRVNAVRPGSSIPEALDHFPNREPMLGRRRKRTPAGRLVAPDDVAGAVAFLCSPDAAMVCGHTLVVDGGYSLLV